MRTLLITLALLAVQCFPVPVTPARAERPLNCKTTCRTDSGGNIICREVCW